MTSAVLLSRMTADCFHAGSAGIADMGTLAYIPNILQKSAYAHILSKKIALD
jgi:hypothetical protein